MTVVSLFKNMAIPIDKATKHTPLDPGLGDRLSRTVVRGLLGDGVVIIHLTCRARGVRFPALRQCVVLQRSLLVATCGLLIRLEQRRELVEPVVVTLSGEVWVCSASRP